MKSPLDGLMKQAQKVQEQMEQAQQELAQIEVVGEAGGGLVKVTMNCRHEARRVAVDASLLGDDKDMLEDLIAAAINDATTKIEVASKDKLAGVAGGFNLPGGFKMPF